MPRPTPTSSAASVEMHGSTLASLVHDRSALNPDDTALRFRVDGRWREQTWAELADRVDVIAAGLITCGVGLAAGDAVGLLAETSIDWVAADFAAMSIGALTVPIYTSLPAPEVGYMHVDTDIKVLIVDDAVQYAKVQEMSAGFELFGHTYLPQELALRHVVVIDPTGIPRSPDWESLGELERRGRQRLEEWRGTIRRLRAAVDPAATTTFTYTSGTTGPPKAVTQSSDNHLAMIDSVREARLLDGNVKEGGLFLFLPLAHSFGRLVQFVSPAMNVPIVISSVPTLARDIVEARPGFVPAAPRVFEKIKIAVEQQASASPIKNRILNWALRAGRVAAERRIADSGRSARKGIAHRLADRLVLSRIRGKLGLDRAVGLLSGAAPLQPEVQWFFLSLGINLYEAYGLTETCPGLSANRPSAMRIGTVGKPLPGVEIRIGAGAEIIARGPNITRGYHNRPAETREVIDTDGWFHTGDQGSIDEDGYLTITGRTKELIKTSGGKYVAPAKIEGLLRVCPLIQEAVVLGDGYNYCTALIAVDEEYLLQWAGARSLPADINAPEVIDAIQAHIDAVNEGLASFETLKRWTTIAPPTVQSGLLTASLKVKRAAVIDTWAGKITEMYAANEHRRPRTDGTAS
ncbi:AMP-binding protein [Microbacterium oxydans]|uniref:AMP-dependent synthetase/ligase n=2 Tax=Microbacteriaceae TaxID=85023 RepID=UPI00332688F4